MKVSTIAIALLFSSLIHAEEDSCMKKVQIILQMSEKDRAAYTQNTKFLATDGAKLTKREAESEQNFDITFSTRGQSSIKAPRKNFGFELLDNQGKLAIGSVKGEKLLFTSMWQDEGYISNMLGYSLLRRSGLAPHATEYAELIINGETNGLYLVTKRMKDVATKDLDSPLVIRRRYFGKYDVAAFKEKKSTFSQAELEGRYTELMEVISSHRSFADDSSEFYDRVSKYIDLNQYFSWLGTNYLLKNGDYSDEVFFYAKAKGIESLDQVKFGVLPWDMDDLFKDQMHWQYFHPGNIKAVLGGKPEKDLVYNYEAQMDRALMGNSYTRKLYHAHLRKMLQNELSEQNIKATMSEVREKISPYLTTEILAQSAKDSINEGKPYTKEFILSLIDQREKEMLERRNEMLKALK